MLTCVRDTVNSIYTRMNENKKYKPAVVSDTHNQNCKIIKINLLDFQRVQYENVQADLFSNMVR